jgi:hypothetical protein
MFRARGETLRIDVADAFARHAYVELGIGNEYSAALGTVRYCLKIRNQYAHCVWWDDNSGNLAFANLEEIAKGNAFLKDLTSLTTKHIDLATLVDQEDYFACADEFLSWINFEGRKLVGTLRENSLRRPTKRGEPPLHIS